MISSRGDIGSAINNAIDKHHVEKRALAVVRRIHKMADKKFMETWEHLQHYFDVLGFQKRYDDMPKLALAPQVAGDGEKPEGEAQNDGPKLKLIDAPREEGEEPPTALADAMDQALEKDAERKAAAFH